MVGLLPEASARAAILTALGRLREGRIEFVEGDRRTAVGPPDAFLSAQITVHEPRFWRALIKGSASFGEAYGDGVWDCDDLVALVRIAAREMPRLDRLRRPLAPLAALLTRVPRNTPEGSQRNIAAHYDLGNELFALFLDETLTYSCAIFETPGATLREAQEAKFDRICRKLELTEDDEVVEIGTGWGGFAVHAASQYGCRVTTTTISREQHAFASERVRAEGLEDRVTLLLQDYRDLRGRFDKLVSVEMVEAVGWQYLDTFLRCCSELLTPDGAMLLQVITMDDRTFEVEKATQSFMKTIIFPGCCLPSVEVIRSSVARSTNMRALDIEDIGDHYPATLQHWRELFLANEQKIAELGYDRRFRRIWHFYLAWCQAGFIERRTSDAQVLLAKPAYRRSFEAEPRETRVPEALATG